MYDRETDRVETIAAADCGFGYRTSRFRYRDRWTVLAVAFRLRASDVSGPLRYGEVSRALGERASLADVRGTVLGLRRAKGMVIDPGDPDSVSAGSFFTNPILERERFETIPGSPPAFPEPDGRVKTSAAWLIERAGFTRGYGDGHAGISTKHTLALVNRGKRDHRGADQLARTIAGRRPRDVRHQLTPEPVLIGHSW